MAKGGGKTRQVTISFNLNSPVDTAMFRWLKETAENYGLSIQALARSCMAAGRKAGEEKARKRYEQLTGADAVLVAEFGDEAAAIAKQREEADKEAKEKRERRAVILDARQKAAADPSGQKDPGGYQRVGLKTGGKCAGCPEKMPDGGIAWVDASGKLYFGVGCCGTAERIEVEKLAAQEL